MDKEFRRAFAALNKEQKKAVETLDGPVLVIAGPGTGKTQLLSNRVANILKKTDTRPSNILCLTYTNKAAVNMRNRIIELAGPEGARVPASTFHSFAGEIMNLYPDYFWNAARLTIAPDSVQLDIIESIIAELPLDNPLAQKFAGQYTLLKSVKGAIGLAKDAGLTPEKLKALVEFNLSYIDKIEPAVVKLLAEPLTIKKLPALAAEIEGLTKQDVELDYYPLTSLTTAINDSLTMAVEADLELGKCTNTSKWKSRWMQTVAGQKGMISERSRNDWWLNLAAVYQSYRIELHRRGFYDYADMLIETIYQLEQNPEMLAEVQERFTYVLVDEFQDSTPAQLRLAHLIADHYSAEGKPNLMVVGDDDQTIFKFNGAEVNNMLNFERYYPSVQKIVLTANYRSAQDILDFAKQVIEQADTRLVKVDKSLTKELVAAKVKGKGDIRVLSYGTSEVQISEIARDVQQNYKPSESMAVLARNHDSLIRMAGVLRQLQVPIRYEQAANILDHEIVNQTYLVAKLSIAIQSGDKAVTNGLIHQILRWPAWGIESKELWRLASKNYPDHDWLESLLNSSNPKIKAMGEWFVWLAKEADSQALAVTIEQMLGLRESGEFTSPVRDYFLSTTKEQPNAYFHGLSAIQLLRNLVHEFSPQRQPKLADLVRFVEINRQNEIVIPDESPYVTGPDAVQLLTVHKAKGLEFDRVYVIDLIDGNWRPRVGGRKPPANLPLQAVGEDYDDYVRLMYVAVTRAKTSLTVSGYWQDHSGRDVSLSSIIQSVKPFKKVKGRSRRQLITVLEENLHWPQLTTGDERQILAARLEYFNLNVTQLIHFLDVTKYGPRYFKERHLLRLPELKTPSQSFGTAIHAAMSQAQHLTNKNRFNLAKITKEFEAALDKEDISQADIKRYRREGKQLLTKLFDVFGYSLPPGSLAEYRLRDVKMGDAMISGVLDRVDRINDDTTVIDYKTGRPLSRLNTSDMNLQIKAYRHKMQLVFYALLLDARGGLPGAVSGQMVYLESADVKKLSLIYTPTDKDKERLSDLINAIWRRIQKIDFPDTSGYDSSLKGIHEFEDELLKKY